MGINMAHDMRNYVLTYLPLVKSYVDMLPAYEDEVLCFYNDGGNDADHIFMDKGNINHKFLRIIARSKSSDIAVKLLDDLSDILEHTVMNKTINGTWYLSIHHKTGGEVKLIGSDERSRWYYEVKYQVNFQTWSNY